MKKKIVCDICDTLFYSNTTFDFLDFFCEIEGKNFKFRKNFFIKLANRLSVAIGCDVLRIYGAHLLRGKERNYLLDLAKNFATEHLSSKKIHEVHSIISSKRNSDCELILCSASFDFIVEAIADNLGITHWYGTELEYTNGICTGKISLDILGNKQKIFGGNIDTIITDNKSDIDLVMSAKIAYIVIYPNTKKYWRRRRPNAHFISVSK